MLDPNIALQYKGMQLNDPMEQMGKAMALSQMTQQNQYMQQRMDEANRAATLGQMRGQAYMQSGGNPATLRQMLADNGDYEGLMAHDKQQLDAQKAQGELATQKAGLGDKLIGLRAKAAQFAYTGGTVQHAQQAAQLLAQSGDMEGAQHIMQAVQQFPDATPEQVRQFFQPHLALGQKPEDLLNPKYQDIGGQLIDINPNTKSAAINKTQTPESVASNQVAREGHQITVRGQNMVDTRDRERIGIARDKEVRESTAQQRLDQQNQQSVLGAQGSKALLAEMRQLVRDNPRGTATPLAGPARFAESMKGVFDPSAKAGPAIRFNQLRDTLLATVEGLRKDGRMSNQDRQRLENAVGSGMTTPANTTEALNTIEEIIDRMSGSNPQGQQSQGQSDYLSRRKNLLGY